MGPMSHQRYGCWSEQAPPPLPAKRTGDSRSSCGPEMTGSGSRSRIDSSRPADGETNHAGETSLISRELRESTLIRYSESTPANLVSISLTGDDGALSGSDVHPIESTSAERQGPVPIPQVGSECEDESMAQEIVLDPSKWILLNQETGQELDAQAFVEAIMLLSTPHHNPFNVNSKSKESQAPFSGSWGVRRQRSTGQLVRRPSMLPAINGGRHENSAQNLWQSVPPDVGTHTPQSLLQPAAHSSKSPHGRPNRFPGARGATSMSAPPNPSTRNTGNITISVSGGEGGFNLSKVRLTQVLRDLHVGGIRSMRFSPSGDYLATAGADNIALVFRIRRRRDGSFGGAGQKAVTGGLMSLLGTTPDDGRHNMADVQAEWAVRVLEETPMRVLTGHLGEVVALSWAPDDGTLLTGSADGTVRCWHPQEGDYCAAIYEHGGRVTSVAWDPASTFIQPGGGRFLTGCMDGKLRIFSLDSSEAEACVLAERPVTAVEFAPGGLTFVAGLVGGGVRFYRTDGMIQEMTAECRRHGIRHQARHATSPVRRLSVGSNRVDGKRKNTTGRGRRNSSMAHSRGSHTAEGRVTGLCFRPQVKLSSEEERGLPEESARTEEEGRMDSSIIDLDQSTDEMHYSMSTDSVPEERLVDEDETAIGNQLSSERAPASTATTAKGDVPKASNESKELGSPWVGYRGDILVSTNDSRARVLDPGRTGGVAVRLKLKGHNTEGVLGWHAVARYSDDGEFVVSGSADGYVHVWPASGAAPPTAPKRAVAWSSNREGHERVLVCAGKVAVPSAIFAPDNVARSIGGDSTRMIVTGDAEGSVKVFIG